MKTKDWSSIVCGSRRGKVEFRHFKDLSLKSSFQIHTEPIERIIQLDCHDLRRFISASADFTLKTWSEQGRVLQTFVHSTWVYEMMSLRSDVVVSAAGNETLKRVSTVVTTSEPPEAVCLKTIRFLHSKLTSTLTQSHWQSSLKTYLSVALLTEAWECGISKGSASKWFS